MRLVVSVICLMWISQMESHKYTITYRDVCTYVEHRQNMAGEGTKLGAPIQNQHQRAKPKQMQVA